MSFSREKLINVKSALRNLADSLWNDSEQLYNDVAADIELSIESVDDAIRKWEQAQKQLGENVNSQIG